MSLVEKKKKTKPEHLQIRQKSQNQRLFNVKDRKKGLNSKGAGKNPQSHCLKGEDLGLKKHASKKSGGGIAGRSGGEGGYP